jgi:plasmid stability protein
MASLLVRNLDSALIDRLKRRAARNGRSMEAEHREILRQVLSSDPRPSFKEVAVSLRAMTAGQRHAPAEKLLRQSRHER